MGVVVLIESVEIFLTVSVESFGFVVGWVLKHRIIEIGIFEHQFGL